MDLSRISLKVELVSKEMIHLDLPAPVSVSIPVVDPASYSTPAKTGSAGRSVLSNVYIGRYVGSVGGFSCNDSGYCVRPHTCNIYS